MAARARVDGQAGCMKQFAVKGMQGSAAVLSGIGPVRIHRRKGMAKRQAWYAADHAVHLSEAQKGLHGQRRDRGVERHQLQMFVRLAGAGYLSRVVAGEGVHLGETDEEGFAVFMGELTALIFERTGGDQEMVFEHTTCVQEGEVGRGNWCNKEILIVWKRIDLRLSGFGDRFCSRGFQHTHLEWDAVLLDRL